MLINTSNRLNPPEIKFELELNEPVRDLIWGSHMELSEWAKPIWVFAGPSYYASGGLQNLRGRYDTQQAAVAALVEGVGKSIYEDGWDWYQIVDVRTGTLLRHCNGGGHGSRLRREPPSDVLIYDWPDCVVAVPEDTEENNLLEMEASTP